MCTYTVNIVHVSLEVKCSLANDSASCSRARLWGRRKGSHAKLMSLRLTSCMHYLLQRLAGRSCKQTVTAVDGDNDISPSHTHTVFCLPGGVCLDTESIVALTNSNLLREL